MKSRIFLLITASLLIIIAAVVFITTQEPQDTMTRTVQDNALSADIIANKTYDATNGAVQGIVIGRGVTSAQTNNLSQAQIDNYTYDATNGAVQLILSSNSSDIPFINTTSLSDGDYLTYNAASEYWVNTVLPSGVEGFHNVTSFQLEPTTTDRIDFVTVFDADGGVPIFQVDSTNERIGVGTAAPIATLDVVGGKSDGVRIIAAATGTIAITDRIVIVDYTTTGPVALTLPAASTAWNATSGTGIQFLIKDLDANAATNNITISRAGSDTIVDLAAAQTSTAITSNGGAIWIGAIAADTWIVY